MDIRVRYAPSPTGLQHIGGIRTALFNYLFARASKGKFILRLEDTDRSRYDPAFERNLYETFAWLGICWDEGPDVGGPVAPYVQSQRTEIYRRYAQELLEKGQAYRCFCSADRLEKIRKEREAEKSQETGYDRHCRAIDTEESTRRAEAGESFTVRLKIPLEEDLKNGKPDDVPAAVTRFTDKLLGDIEWKNSDINPDPVLLKSDGFPTYHLANVVDDHLMGITHVLRAQEWLSSTPLHVLLYQAFGWEPPVFCHLPMVMGQDGKKLSKRHGAASVDEFRRQGYLAEALVNYTALLGCSYEEGSRSAGHADLYKLEELENYFTLDKLNKAPAVFDYKKLEWYNGQYIRTKSNKELAGLSLPWAIEQGLFGPDNNAPAAEETELYEAAMELVRERASYLPEIPAKLGYLFSEPALPAIEEFIPKKLDRADAIVLLRMGRSLFDNFFPDGKTASDEEMENIVKEKAEKETVKLGDLLMPLRVALTGSRVSPPLFGSIRLLGKEKCLSRIDRALSALTASAL